MAKLQAEIANTFLQELRERPEVTPEMIDGLRELMSGEKKLKADDLVKIFAPPPGGDVQ